MAVLFAEILNVAHSDVDTVKVKIVWSGCARFFEGNGVGTFRQREKSVSRRFVND